MTSPRVAAGVVALLLALGGAPAVAQTDPLLAFPAASNEERVQLRVGDILEIAGDAGVGGAQFSWILTQDRAFVEAGRDPVFRYRFVQEKTYALQADVLLPGGLERRQRTFAIEVLPQGSPGPNTGFPAGTGASLATTFPAPDTNRRVVLTPDQQLVQLIPLDTDVKPLAVDYDATRDTDGDGNPANDVDNTGTYFHSYGRSLWVWIARPLAQVELTITGIPAGGSPLVQRITVLSEEAARGQGVLTSPVEIVTNAMDGGRTFSFSPVIVRPGENPAPLLYEWEFGDGGKSLENNPVYTYATGGTFEVRLRVRDLQTGTTVGENSTTVQPVDDAGPIDEPVDPVDEPTDPVDEEPVGEPFPWGRVLFIGGIFVGSIVLGLLLVWLLSFLRRSRSLEQTLESMEKAVVPQKEQAPPPLAIKGKAPAPADPAAAAKQKVIDAEVSASTPSKAPAPAVTEAAAPDWLKKGLATDQQAAKPAPAAPPVAKPTPAPAAPAPSATKPATPTAQPAPAKPAAPAPAPAKQTPPPAAQPGAVQKPAAAAPATPQAKPVQPKPATPPAPAAPKPTPVPAPKAPTQQATPKPTAAPAKPAAPAPASTPAAPAPTDKLPHWLQPTPPAPAATPTPAPSPATTPTPTPTPAPAPAAAPAPTPVAPTAPVAAPVTPPPAPKPEPVAAPAPQAPATSTTPAPIPAPAPKPTPAPASVVPAPVPTPAPAATPKPPVPQAPSPIPPIAPVTPPPAPAPKPPVPTQPIPPLEPPSDETIAVIRADSIDPGPAK